MTEEKRYKRGIVTFMDILGFRDLLERKSPGELSQLLALFRSEGSPRAGFNDEFDRMFEYTALSDCFFRGAETDHELNRQYPTGHLFHELLGIVHIQCRLIQEGHLIRGATTHGEYCAERDEHGAVFFGLAVARAYELESKHARYPRVLVDPLLIEEFWQSDLLKNVIHKHRFEWDKYLSRLLRQDDSGVWFVDYLRGIWGNYDYEPHDTGTFYLQHKRFIEQRLNQWAASDKTRPDSISEKLLWLLQYHNAVMRGLTDADWGWLLSPEDCSVDRDAFFIGSPDHALFKSYPPT